MTRDTVDADLAARLADKLTGGPEDVNEGIELLNRHLRARVLHFLRDKFALPPDDAEEVWQEALTAIWQAARAGKVDLDRHRTVLPWIWQICRNQATDCVRRRKPQHSMEAVSFQLGKELSPEAAAIERENQADRSALSVLVRTWVDELPEPDKSIMQLRFFTGMKYQEIATALGLPGGTVASKLFRCLNLFRERAGIRFEDLE